MEFRLTVEHIAAETERVVATRPLRTTPAARRPSPLRRLVARTRALPRRSQRRRPVGPVHHRATGESTPMYAAPTLATTRSRPVPGGRWPSRSPTSSSRRAPPGSPPGRPELADGALGRAAPARTHTTVRRATCRSCGCASSSSTTSTSTRGSRSRSRRRAPRPFLDEAVERLRHDDETPSMSTPHQRGRRLVVSATVGRSCRGARAGRPLDRPRSHRRRDHRGTLPTLPLGAEQAAVMANDGYTGAVTPGGPADVRELPRLTIRKCAVSAMSNNAYLLTCRDDGGSAARRRGGRRPGPASTRARGGGERARRRS